MTPTLLLAIGLLELLVVICLMAAFVRLGAKSERGALLYAVIFAFALLIGTWVVDKTAAHALMLLSENESATLFALVRDAMLLVFGFYFGSASANLK